MSIDFWFDFTSPYAYLMSEKINDLAAVHHREVNWRPILLGVIFQHWGGRPLLSIPMKGEYSKHDLVRSAHFLQLPFQLPPDPFPLIPWCQRRAFYALQQLDKRIAIPFAQAVFRAIFQQGINVMGQAQCLELASRLGLNEIQLSAFSLALEDVRFKEQLRAENELAINTGVFGAPFVVIDGEPFWGVDRLPQIEAWLSEKHSQ